eukprot:scaffold3118_cov264-Pinguiococcus_pyrenoidosus.AAC.4
MPCQCFDASAPRTIRFQERDWPEAQAGSSQRSPRTLRCVRLRRRRIAAAVALVPRAALVCPRSCGFPPEDAHTAAESQTSTGRGQSEACLQRRPRRIHASPSARDRSLLHDEGVEDAVKTKGRGLKSWNLRATVCKGDSAVFDAITELNAKPEHTVPHFYAPSASSLVRIPGPCTDAPPHRGASPATAVALQTLGSEVAAGARANSEHPHSHQEGGSQ